jgi:hypothetical protein
LSGAVAIRLAPESRRFVDEFHGLGRALGARLDEHDDGTATVVFSGGDFGSSATAEWLEEMVMHLGAFAIRPAVLQTDRDSERGAIHLGGAGPCDRGSVTLADGAEGCTGALENDGSCLAIRPAGYGEAEAADGHGAPVLREFYGGTLRLIVAPNINSTDRPIIEVDEARESNRT